MSRDSLADNGRCVSCYRRCNAYICEECCFDSDYVAARAFWDDVPPHLDSPTFVAKRARKRQEARAAYDQMVDCWGALDYGVIPAGEEGRWAVGKNALPDGAGQIARSARLRRMIRAEILFTKEDRRLFAEASERVCGPSRIENGDAHDRTLRRKETRAKLLRRSMANLGKCFSSVGWALLDELTRPE